MIQDDEGDSIEDDEGSTVDDDEDGAIQGKVCDGVAKVLRE